MTSILNLILTLPTMFNVVLPRRKRLEPLCKLLARVENERIASRLMVKGQKNDFRDAEAIPR
jgi:hypothetical protein